MLSTKKRDAKFLIFQSLYIIAISILFYKGTDLSLVAVKDATDSTNAYLSSTETKIDTSLLNDLSKNNSYVDTEKDSVIDRNTLAQITNRANENNKVSIIQPKTIIPTPIPPKQDEKKPLEKKKESDPSPVPDQNLKEYTNQSFTNPDPDRKMFVYQDGSMLGVVEPGKSKTLRMKKGGKINYTFSN